jgi:predicted ArsR family transcriptional regulator
MTSKNNTDQQMSKSVEEVEKRLIGMFASIYSRAIEAMCARYGPEAFEIARQAFMDTIVETSEENFANMQERDLHSYVAWLTSDGTEEGHEYETVESTEDSIRLKYVNCPWATCFRAIGHPEIGKFFCDADAPIASAFNEDIKFERTQTLMDGDDFCNHHFFIEKD